MWNNKNGKQNRLSREILASFGLAFVISLAGFWLLNECANQILLRYVEEELLMITENQLIGWQYRILGFSMLAGVIFFVVLFLVFVGERLAYIQEIVKGIDALGQHQWDYEIPLRGKNELTELAKQVNELSKAEEAFQIKEKQLQEEKISLMRSLSHDIRTPLTSLMSYSEFLKQKEHLTAEEMKDYMNLVEQKSRQIKVLTDRLLDGGSRQLEFVENGHFLMEQLVEAWVSELEEDFEFEIHLENNPQFSGEFDIHELQRIFDNLASNIRKYADETAPVFLEILERDGRVCVHQANKSKAYRVSAESRKIGIANIRKIAEHYGGEVYLSQTDNMFFIRITLMKIGNNL